MLKFINFAATIFHGHKYPDFRFHGHKSKWHFCPSQPWNSITANLPILKTYRFRKLEIREFMVLVGSPLSNCCLTDYHIPAPNLNIWCQGCLSVCMYMYTYMYVRRTIWYERDKDNFFWAQRAQGIKRPKAAQFTSWIEYFIKDGYFISNFDMGG